MKILQCFENVKEFKINKFLIMFGECLYLNKIAVALSFDCVDENRAGC